MERFFGEEEFWGGRKLVEGGGRDLDVEVPVRVVKARIGVRFVVGPVLRHRRITGSELGFNGRRRKEEAGEDSTTMYKEL